MSTVRVCVERHLCKISNASIHVEVTREDFKPRKGRFERDMDHTWWKENFGLGAGMSELVEEEISSGEDGAGCCEASSSTTSLPLLG